MPKYRIVVLIGDSNDIEATMNSLAAEGYRLCEVVQPATATSPTTIFKPLAIMEYTETLATRPASESL